MMLKGTFSGGLDTINVLDQRAIKLMMCEGIRGILTFERERL